MEYLKVLVVHRQVAMLEKVKSILKKFGTNMRGYSCGIDGLHAAKLEHFDLILSGTDLPLITGFEMIRSIRNLSKNCLTPVVFMTERIEEAHVELARRLKGAAVAGTRNLETSLPYAVQVLLPVATAATP